MENKEKPFTMYVADVNKLFHDHIRKVADKRGLNSTYIRIFMLLNHEEKVTQNDIVNFTHHKAPTISLTLQKMEAEGLIKRVNDESDLRNTIVKFTDKGREVDKELKSILEEEDTKIQNLFSDKEKELVIKKLSEVINYLEDKK